MDRIRVAQAETGRLPRRVGPLRPCALAVQKDEN